MNANILVPSSPPMLSSSTEVKAFCMMMNMTVAMTVATVVKRAAKKVKIPVKRVSQREKTARGFKSIITKDKQAPARKRPNIQCETTLISPRISVTSVGSVTKKVLAWDTRKLGRQILTSCTRQQLVEDDLHRVEPVQSLGTRAVGYTLSIVALAEAPKSDTVEIVQTNSLGNRVDDSGVGNTLREDVGQVDVDEVNAALDASSAGATNLYQDQEDDCEEKEEG